MHAKLTWLLFSTVLLQPLMAAEDRRLFDFETEDEVRVWAVLLLPDAKSPEPPVKLERSTEHATTGRHSLKLTFAGGTWPGVATRAVPADWTPWQTFTADVTVSRACVVGFCVMQEGSSRAGGWDGGVSRWAKTEFLQPGRNTISAQLHPNAWSALRPQLENGRVLGRVVSLEFFCYQPHAGEVIHVDNIRLGVAKEPAASPPKTQFQVLGTDLVVSSVQELSKLLAPQWTPPPTQTVAQVETLSHQPAGSDSRGSGRVGQPTVQPGECHRPVERGGAGDADAGERLAQQLGLPGDGHAGVESQGVVCVIGAGSGARPGIAEDGVPDLSASDHGAARPDRADGLRTDLPGLGLQPLVEGFPGAVGTDSGVSTHRVAICGCPRPAKW